MLRADSVRSLGTFQTDLHHAFDSLQYLMPLLNPELAVRHARNTPSLQTGIAACKIGSKCWREMWATPTQTSQSQSHLGHQRLLSQRAPAWAEVLCAAADRGWCRLWGSVIMGRSSCARFMRISPSATCPWHLCRCSTLHCPLLAMSILQLLASLMLVGRVQLTCVYPVHASICWTVLSIERLVHHASPAPGVELVLIAARALSVLPFGEVPGVLPGVQIICETITADVSLQSNQVCILLLLLRSNCLPRTGAVLTAESGPAAEGDQRGVRGPGPALDCL